MLMKYVKIQKDGTVVGLENKSAIKYGYGSMLNLRVKLTYSFSISGIIMPTICLHDVLKRQGLEKSQNNRKMITDLLCLGFGTIIANKNTQHLFQLFLKNIREKNFQKADENLIDCHIISATSKALSSNYYLNQAEQPSIRLLTPSHTMTLLSSKLQDYQGTLLTTSLAPPMKVITQSYFSRQPNTSYSSSTPKKISLRSASTSNPQIGNQLQMLYSSSFQKDSKP